MSTVIRKNKHDILEIPESELVRKMNELNMPMAFAAPTDKAKHLVEITETFQKMRQQINASSSHDDD